MSMEIPNRFDHAEACPRLYQQWESAGCFHAEVNTERVPYTIVIPPPNVTGALHLGHGLNNTLQDSLIRFKRMQGYETLWMPGTDHAGIATQAVVERRLKEQENKTRHDLGREELVRRIWAWKDQYESRILSQLKRMGCSCDWRRTRFTLDPICARAVRATFFDLFAKRLIYRGKRLVNWDTFLQTAVSDDEVFTETTKGHFWHLRYPVIDPQAGQPTYLEVATTRPETMLGDTAVAVHPDPQAALHKIEADLREKLATASAKEREEIEVSLEALGQRRQTHLPLLISLRDMARQGCRLKLPLLGREIPLVADPWAKPELGSGCVKITPAHDPNDYEVGNRCGLERINILNPDGTLNEVAGPYAGLTISRARAAVVADLEAGGFLSKVEDRDIELPYSDRSKTPIEPYLADQWFVQMDSLAQSAIDAVVQERVQIFPARYRKGYIDWLSEKRDWPVSRQLWWGHRIPIWTAQGTAERVHQWQQQLKALAEENPGQFAIQIEAETTVQICIRDESPELEAAIEALGFVQDADVLDTWFSSALWPHSTLGWPQQTKELAYFYPTSTLITSRDIITLWVARMVLMGLNNLGEVPFREVFVHPKILDGLGETMSKSKGNGVDPVEVIDKFGPDALRFGLAWLTTDTQDVRMPVQFECPACGKLMEQTKKNRTLPRIECSSCNQPFSTQWAEQPADQALPRGAVVSERFEFARNFVNKLWNAARFVILNLEGYEPQVIDPQNLPLEDRWLLSRLATTTARVTQSLDSYQYGEASRVLYDFAWDDFCSFYVEIAKPRLNDRGQRAMIQGLLAGALDTLLRLLHPLMPFVTEEIWQTLAKVAPRRGLVQIQEDSRPLMRGSWPDCESRWMDSAIEKQFSLFQAVLGAIREIRSRQNIAPRECLTFSVRCPGAVTQLLLPMTPYFEAMAGAVPAQWGMEVTPPPTGAHLPLAGMEIDVYVDLERFIDVRAELERNSKLLERVVKQIAGKEQKLQNESFISRAPAEIVAREQESLDELREQQSSLEAAIRVLEKKEASA